jgi:hypothetical protein
MCSSSAGGRDTSDEVAAVQVRRWQQMTPSEKAGLVAGLSVATHRLAEAGVAARYPLASPRERFLRVALLRLGPDLAVLAYPDAACLEP